MNIYETNRDLINHNRMKKDLNAVNKFSQSSSSYSADKLL